MLEIYKSAAETSAAAGLIFRVADMAEVDEEQVICFILAEIAFGIFNIGENVTEEVVSELDPGMSPEEVEEAVPDDMFEELADQIDMAMSQVVPTFLLVRALARDPALREICLRQATETYDMEKSNLGEIASHARRIAFDPVLKMFREGLIESANKVEEDLKSEGGSDVDLSDIDLPEL